MTATFGTELRQRREQAGLSLTEVAYLLRDTLPLNMRVSFEKIRRLETGNISEKDADSILLAGLAKVYGCKLSDISPALTEDAERVRDLLVTSLRCSSVLSQKVLADVA